MDGSLDLTGIISAIAENPELLGGLKSVLSSLVGSKSKPGENIDEEDKGASIPLADAQKDTEQTAAEPAGVMPDQKKRRRKELLCALKPYVCTERSKAIDTMLSLSDVLDVLKEG